MAEVSAGLDLIRWKTSRFVKTKTAITSWCRPCVRRCVQRFLLLVRLCAHISVIQLLRYCFSQVPPLKKEKQCKHKLHNTANIQAPVDGLFLVKLEVVGMRNSYLFACLLYIWLHAMLFRWVCGIFIFTTTCGIDNIISVL